MSRTRVNLGFSCSFEPCAKPARTKGLCYSHYSQHRRGAPLSIAKPRYPRAHRNDQGNKWCSRCATFQPEAQFPKCASAPDGLHSWCRTCLRQNDQKRRYGITKEVFAEMLAAQGGVCAACGTDEPGSHGWCLDHDHSCCDKAWTCGQCNRGVLCGPCNKGLGHFSDDPEKLRGAAAYLEAYESRGPSVRAL